MEQQKETLTITGMTCGNCVKHVQKALDEIDGVTVGEVTIGSAEVSYDPSEVDRAKIIEAIEESGYNVAA
jgi:copper chaperone CopZ